MFPCKKCKRNDWEMHPPDGGKNDWGAICRFCGNLIFWTSDKPFHPHVTDHYHVNDPCQKCATPIILKESDSNLYTAYYCCPGCGAVFFDQKFKRK